jgi:NodT family efflux transporter outer membrane factor (OMF) lipoprotein
MSRATTNAQAVRKLDTGWTASICQRGIVVFSTLALCSCAVGPDFVRPAPPTTERYTEQTLPNQTVTAAGTSQRFISGEEVPADWWKYFQSDALNQIVANAMKNNPTVQAAQASLRRSQDNLQAGYGVFYPQFSLSASAGRYQNAPIQQGSTSLTSIFNLMTISGMISYAIDVFGRSQRTVEGLKAQVENQRDLTQAAYITLAANVVNTTIARAAYLAQIQSTEEMLKLEREQLQVTEAQVTAGTVPFSNVLTLRSLIASNEGALAPLRQKVSQAEHLLATLQGLEPSAVKLPDIDLAALHLPTSIPVSLPSEMVRQRPDILAAEAQMHVASANIGVATAAMFPSFSLSGTYGTSSSSFANLTPDSQTFWSIGPSASLPVFQGGALWFGRQAAIDAFEQSQQTYRQTVLTAFAQVADSLTALQYDAQAVQALLEASNSADEALKIAGVNYRAGLISYLDVLFADIQLHQANIAFLQALAQRHQNTVALFVALGGGWWSAPGATRDEGPNK